MVAGSHIKPINRHTGQNVKEDKRGAFKNLIVHKFPFKQVTAFSDYLLDRINQSNNQQTRHIIINVKNKHTK